MAEKRITKVEGFELMDSRGNPTVGARDIYKRCSQSSERLTVSLLKLDTVRSAKNCYSVTARAS